MVGRQLVANIDSRLEQAKPHNPHRYALGGVSYVGIGDPARCEAIGPQQVYDCTLHKDTVLDVDATNVALSNRGLDVHSEFSEVVVLSNVHRLHKHDAPPTPEEIAHNGRSDAYLPMPHWLA